MNAQTVASFITQLDSIISTGDGLTARSEYSDWDDVRTPEAQAFATRCLAAIARIAPPGSPYRRGAEAASQA